MGGARSVGAMPGRQRADDERLLAILDVMHGSKLAAAAIRARFGLTNGQLQGIRLRDRMSVLPCACKKPENRDGGMPALWWSS